MIQMDEFITRLLKAAGEAGIEPAEVYCAESSAFSAEAMQGNIDSYEVSETCALSLRGMVNGKTGYASTEAFDEDAIRMLIRGVQESAALVETEEQDEIFAGDPAYPELEIPESDLDSVTPEEKLQFALEMEKAAMKADPRIVKSEGSGVSTGRGTLRLVNSYGLNLKAETPPGGYVRAGIGLLGKDGESSATGGESEAGRRFRDLNPENRAGRQRGRRENRRHAERLPGGKRRLACRDPAGRHAVPAEHLQRHLLRRERAKEAVPAGRAGGRNHRGLLRDPDRRPAAARRICLHSL